MRIRDAARGVRAGYARTLLHDDDDVVSVSSRSIFCACAVAAVAAVQRSAVQTAHADSFVFALARINFNQVKHEKQTRKGNEANCILFARDLKRAYICYCIA